MPFLRNSDDINYIEPGVEDDIIEAVYYIYGWPYFAFKYFWETSFLLPDTNGIAFGWTFNDAFTVSLYNIAENKNIVFNYTQLVLDALNFSFLFSWIAVFGALPYYLILAIPHSPILLVLAVILAIPVVLIFGPPVGIIIGIYYFFDWALNGNEASNDNEPESVNEAN